MGSYIILIIKSEGWISFVGGVIDNDYWGWEWLKVNIVYIIIRC